MCQRIYHFLAILALSLSSPAHDVLGYQIIQTHKKQITNSSNISILTDFRVFPRWHRVVKRWTLQKKKGENYRGPPHAGGVNNPSGGTNASKSKKVPTETTTDADPEPVSIVGANFWCLHPQTSKSHSFDTSAFP